MHLHLAEVVEDRGVSGKRWKSRAGLQRIKQLAASGKVGSIIVCDMSRLGRSSRELLNSLSYLEDDCGCSVVFLKERVDTATSGGKLMRTVLAGISEFELDQIRTRTEEGRAAKRAAGVPMNLTHCYGYDYHGSKANPVYTINEEEAKVARRVITWLFAGLSLTKICGKLKDQHVCTKAGNTHWTPQGLAYSLLNPVMYGNVVENRWKWTDKVSEKTGEPYRKRTLRPRAEWKVLTKLPDAIMSRDEHARIEQLVHSRNRSRNVAANDPFVLRDLVFCGECPTDNAQYAKMTPIFGQRRKSGGRYPSYYACYWSRQSNEAKLKDREPCSLPHVPSAEIEEIVFSFAKRVLLQPTIFVDKLLHQKNLKADLASAEREVAEAGRKIKVIDKAQVRAATKLINDPNVPERVQKSIIADLEQQRGSLVTARDDAEERLAGLQHALRTREIVAERVADIARLRGVAAGVLDDLSHAQKRRLIVAALGGARILVNETSGRILDKVQALIQMAHSSEIAKTDDTRGALVSLVGTSRRWSSRTGKRGRPNGNPPKDTSGGWWVSLAGRVDVGLVLDSLAEFAEGIRPRIYRKSQNASASARRT